MATNQSASTTGLPTNDTWGSGASLQVKLSSTGLLQNQVCDGSTLAAATAPLPKCSSSGVRQSQYKG